jgi:GAF domain-containing protein
MDEGVVGYVATHNQHLMVRDVLNDPQFKEKAMARNLGLASMLGVPHQGRDGKVIGVLNCFTSEPHDFSDTEINLITAVANQVAVAILNTELMVKTKVIQEELETLKLVERAKEVLMRRRNMKADEAFRWIQKRSMDSRKSMGHMAEAVLLSEELE